jgi:zinc protease
MMQGMNSIRRAMSPFPPESIHYVPTMDERIDRLRAVQASDLQALHEKHVGASHLDVAVVGDFDAETFTAALQEHFAGWPSPSPYERIVEPYCASTPGTITILTPDKEMAMVAMGTTFPMREDDPRFAAMTLASYVFGQSAKSRLINRLRHEGGLSYGARAMLSADAWEPRASLLGMAICAPQNSQMALEAMREEVQRWVQEGITDEELKDAIESYTLRFRRTLTNEQFLVQELVDGFARDRTLRFRGDLLDDIQKLTVRDVADVLQSVLGNSGFAEILAGDLPAGPDA